MTATTSRIIFESPLFVVGEFQCPPASPLWNAVNLIGATPHVVFPRTTVVIAHAGRPPFLASRNHVVFYNAGEVYRRSLHDRRGDDCVYVSLGPAFAADGPQTFPFAAGPSDAHAYLLQHVAVRALQDARPDVLAVEEAIAGAVTGSIAAANAFHRDAPRKSSRAQRTRYALAESAKSWVIENFTGRSTLSEIAQALHTSPFHLARVFRSETGFSLHDYRNHLRLRTALDRIEDGHDLVRIAHELGYSSHSHFTRAFTRVFGVTPSSLRRKSPKRLLDELRTILAARLAGTP